MASVVHSDHHERILDENDLLAILPEMVRLQDEPIADPVCVPVYYVSKLARDNGVTVCQVGEGADELFYGYPGWRDSLALQRYDRLPMSGTFERLGMGALRLAGRASSWPYEWMRRAAAKQPVFWSGAEAFTQAEKEQLLSRRMRARTRGKSSWDAIQPIRKRFDELAWERSDLNWMTYSDLNIRLPELLLMRVDKMSMGVSLEGRVPFLDHKIVEMALSIPSVRKTAGKTLKPLLKKAVRGIVPDELIDRPKQGFGIPVYDWFKRELGERARTVLTEFARDTDYLDPAGVESLLNSGRAPQIWYLFNLALWWKEYIQ
jgi:asparagine synthase (glutamine-hydrolysing)